MKSFASATFLLVVSLTGCRFDPPGACAADAGCPSTQHCSEGVCVPDGRSALGERCAVERDCASFADCVEDACVLRAGACTAPDQCETWEDCALHACVAAPGRCGGDVDCFPWEVCASTHVCALASGHCGTAAECAAWQTCDAAHVCATSPGRCGSGSECRVWQTCSATWCESVPGMCGTAADCSAWESCVSNACTLPAGRCGGATDCADWQACDATHTCVTAAGRCAADVECGAWQACASHTCDAAPGSCDDASDCTAWESCGGDHVCALATGFCQGSADCAAWQSCGVLHQCVPKPGLCDSAGDCMGWETCTAHACVVAPGRCATGDDCAAFETCGADHHCELPPGACGTQADCEGWQVCTSNVCETAPGRCAADPECAVPTYCLDHACGKPAFSPDEVLLLGSADNIEQSLSWGIVSRLSEPQHPVFGFPAGWNDQIALTSAGEVVYSYSERRGAWKMVPDSARLVGGLWQPPFAADANDVQVTTITCGTSGTYRWLVQSSTNTIVHTCNESTWYDAAGALRFTAPASRRLLAWNAADAKLLRGVGSAVYVLDASGVETTVTGLPATAAPVAWRSRSDAGWSLAVSDSAAAEEQLWTVGPAGAATKGGSYPAVTGVESVGAGHALDASEALYQFVQLGAYRAGVVKRTVSPPTSTIVYDENGGTFAYGSTPPRWWTRVYNSKLVQAP